MTNRKSATCTAEPNDGAACASAPRCTPSDRRRQLVLMAVATPALASLQACGFKPRGAQTLPFATFYTQIPESSPIRGELRRALRANTTLVDKADQAEAIFELQGELRERDVVGFSAAGRPREFQLRYRVRYRVIDRQGVEILPSSEIIQRREITTDDTAALAKQQEEQLLYRDMLNDLVQQIVRRLASLRKPVGG